MNLFEMLSNKKFKLSGNIDERYFQPNDDGTYSATPLFIYNVARDVAADIKAIVIGTKNETYTTVANNKGAGYDVVDSWAKHEHDADWGVKYEKQIKEADKKWKEYRNSHLDEFEQNKSTVDVGDIPTARFFSAYRPDFGSKSVSELMSMYKEAVELKKKYGDELRDTLPQRPGNLISKDEFKDAHDKLRAEIAKKVGLPEDDYKAPTIHIKEKVSLIRSNSKVYKAIPNADGSDFEDYVKGLVTHLTSSTPKAYNEEWKALHTNITDFCNNLSSGGRGTMFVKSRSTAKDGMNVSIYTGNIDDDDENRIKLCGISKVNPDDTFYTFTLYLTSSGKRPVRQISTKAELINTLKDLVDVLKENRLKDYIKCVEYAIGKID